LSGKKVERMQTYLPEEVKTSKMGEMGG